MPYSLFMIYTDCIDRVVKYLSVIQYDRNLVLFKLRDVPVIKVGSQGDDTINLVCPDLLKQFLELI